MGIRKPLWFLLAAFAFVLLARVLSGALFLPTWLDRELGTPVPRWQILEPLVRWSPVLFGRASAGTLERLARTEPRLALEAQSALARVDPRRAAGLIDERQAELGRQGRATSWWTPPVPGDELLRVLGEEFPGAAEGSGASGAARYLRTVARHSCVLTDPDGGRGVVFPHGSLGTDHDLWLYREATGSSLFLGPLRHRPYSRDLELSCELEAGVLVLEWLDRSPPSPCPEPDTREQLGPHFLSISELDLDSDGDGLPDPVELRLALDPYRADTDADGVPDPEDYAPNGGWSPEGGTLEAAAVVAVHQTQLILPEICRWHPVRFVASKAPIEWQSACGPILNIPPEASREQVAGSDILQVYPEISGEEEEGFWQEGFLPTSIDEWVAALFAGADRRLLVINTHLGSDSEGYELRVRETRHGPLLTWYELLWF